MIAQPSVTAIIPAAGVGSRMQAATKKTYLHLNDRPLLAHTLIALDRVPRIEQIMLAVYPGDEEWCQHTVIAPLGLRQRPLVIAGGATRQESVCRALDAMPGTCDLVLIHDGARPLIDPVLVDRVIDAAAAHEAATLALPVTDTVVQADTDACIAATPPRNTLWAIQTPQVFSRALILQAHARARSNQLQSTDDASLVHALGIAVHLVEGSGRNLKITTPDDLLIAQTLYRSAPCR